MTRSALLRLLGALALLLLPVAWAWAHGVAGEDQEFLQRNTGRQLVVFAYLGAKHMVTGYDHLLFLFGVVFFLYRMRDVGIYVTLFALGHSVTLLAGVLGGWHVDPFLIDAIMPVGGLQGVWGTWLVGPGPDADLLVHDHPGLPTDHPHLRESSSDSVHQHVVRIDELHVRWPK